MRNTTFYITLAALLLVSAMTLANPGPPRIGLSTPTDIDDSVDNAQQNMLRVLRQIDGIDRLAIDRDEKAGSVDVFIIASANKALIKYGRLSPKKQRRLAFIAYKIAKLRRTALAHLIQRDPRQALLLSLSPGQRQGLPKFILDLLEARMHVVGDLTLAITEVPPEDDPQGNSQAGPPPPSVTSWTARIGQTTRRAFLYGLRLKHQTKFSTPIHGIALDDLTAIDESPLYQYDPFETVQLGFQPGQIVATMGGVPIVLPDYDAFFSLKKELLDQLLRFGPDPVQFDVYAWSRGPKNLLVIKPYFSDLPGTLYTDAEIIAAVAEANVFYEDNSQGQTSLSPTIIPSNLLMPSTAASYELSGMRLGHARIRDDAKDAARDYDMTMGGSGMYDPDGYDRVLVLTPQLFEDPYANAALGGKSVVISGERIALQTLAHELGHTYGFIHSAFWSVLFGEDPIGPGVSQEYGDIWDMMGIASAIDRTDEDPRRRHFNAYWKSRAGWLPTAAIADGTSGGTFRLYRHDAADAVGLRAIQIVARDGTTYWLGMRRQFPWNPSMAMGFEVRRVLSDPTFLYGPVQLLDMDSVTPGVFGIEVLHSLVRFQIFEDTANGINIRVANVHSDDVGPYADIVITITR